MQRLVDGLLELARIESGSWRPAPVRLETAAATRESCDLVSARVGERRAELVMTIMPGAETLWADPDAYAQVIGNLFENALRYAPPGSTVRFEARPGDSGVVVSVRDQGPGIGSEHLPRIFERFYRADTGRSREEGGTGLGLAIVRHMVEAHGGWVRVESELGKGTTGPWRISIIRRFTGTSPGIWRMDCEPSMNIVH